MKLANLTVNVFITTLASDAPAPGGGSASALAGAMGIALGSMVASLTAGKKKYAELEPIMSAIVKKADPIISGMVTGIDTDTEAFNGVTDALAMPKETDEQKALRNEAKQKALVECTRVPYELIVRCREALEILLPMLEGFNTTAASDLGVAALNLKSAALGAWLNVLINVGSINDAELAERYRTDGQQAVDAVCALSDKIYNRVVGLL